MSHWAQLNVKADPNEARLPRLLIKPSFDRNSYSILLTDLSNIWSEHLGVAGIVDRAQTDKSPIEVSNADAGQLQILLNTIENSLDSTNGARQCVTKSHEDGLIMHTAIRLPEPLGTLHWRFLLHKQALPTLTNELILPLLLASRIQHKQIGDLTSVIAEKDRVITRIADHFASFNLDLAAAFPNIGGTKPGKKLLSREQAAKHITGLQTFDAASWVANSSTLAYISLPKEANLSECLSMYDIEVPADMRSDNELQEWWRQISSKADWDTSWSKSDVEDVGDELESACITSAIDDLVDEDETEDEFETHDHLKARQEVSTGASSGRTTDTRADGSVEKSASLGLDKDAKAEDINDTTSDNSLRSNQTHHVSGVESARETEDQELSYCLLPGKMMKKSFRIGGTKVGHSSRAVAEERSTSENGPIQSSHEPTVAAVAKATKQGFKIGGRVKDQEIGSTSYQENTISPKLRTSKQALAPSKSIVERSPSVHVQEQEEETAEAKANRKRNELKRKNEDLARKQVNNRKKKRF